MANTVANWGRDEVRASQKASGTTKALGSTSGNKMCPRLESRIFSLLCIELYMSWSLKPGREVSPWPRQGNLWWMWAARALGRNTAEFFLWIGSLFSGTGPWKEQAEARDSEADRLLSGQSCPTLQNPMDCSMPGISVLRWLPEFVQIHVHWVKDANNLILCCTLLLLPLIFPSIRVFSNESALCIRWPKCWSFSFSISPFSEYSGLVSLRIDWFDLAIQGTLKNLLQHHSSNASAFFMV